MIDRWARFVARRARTVLALGLLVTVLAGVYGAGVFGSLSQGGFDDPDSEAARALRLEQDTFGNQSADVVAIYSSETLTADDPAFRRAVADVVEGLPEDAIAHVVPYFAAPKAIAPEMVSEDGHHAQVLISLAGDSANGVRLPAAALLVAEKLPDNDPQKKVVVDYKKTYEAKTGQPVSTFGGHAYDGLMILVDAMKRAKSTDKAKVRDEIEKTKNFMGTGGVVNMSATDHLGLDLTAFRMLEIKNGDWTLESK